MKRAVSILLLIVFLFNVGGYYLVYLGLHHHTDQLLTERINADRYNANDVIELKIPVALPYPIQENGFERVDGRFEHKGNFYKLIKQKIENDTLYIVCMKDVDSKRLANTFKDYAAKTNDLPANSKNPQNIFGKFLKDFETLEADIIGNGSGWVRVLAFTDINIAVTSTIISIGAPPPKA